MCATLKSRPWEISQGPLSLKFQIKSYSRTANDIIAIEVVDTQLPKSTKLELFKHNQYNPHLRKNKKWLT